MRRAACIVVCLLVLITGCSGSKPAADPVGEGFTCTVQAVYRDMTVAGTLTREIAGTLTLAFTEPETLNGLTACWNGETVTLSMYGLEFSVDPATVPESALGEEIITAFDTALRGEGERTIEDGKLIVSGNGQNGAYTLTFDAETGEPLSLSVPSLPLSATFFDFEQE